MSGYDWGVETDPRRGRPPLEPDETIRRTVRLTRAQEIRLLKIATRWGMSVAAAIRRLIETASLPKRRG